MEDFRRLHRKLKQQEQQNSSNEFELFEEIFTAMQVTFGCLVENRKGKLVGVGGGGIGTEKLSTLSYTQCG